MKDVALGTVWLLLLGLGGSWGANILVLSPYTCRSHSNFFRPVVRQLADRGHTLTYWNGLEPRDDLPSTVRQLYTDELHDLNSNYQVAFEHNNPIIMYLDFPKRVSRLCTISYQNAIFRELMNTTEVFDLVIVEAVLNECMLPLVYKLNAPFIYLNSIMPTPWMLDALGAPMAFDHVPVVSTDFTDKMNILERVWNTLSGSYIVLFRYMFILPRVDHLVAEHQVATNVPSVGQIERNVSLMITNSHMSINYQFSKPNSLIEAGGLHCVQSQPLAQDLEEFVSGSGDAGFIYLSFGSILRGVDLPASTRQAFVQAFARLPQRVVWKYEGEIDDLPSNIRLSPWLPQQDLLGHPKIKLFITHGGLFSIQEAVYHGVPFIGLPVFADQFNNIRKAEEDGYAIHLNWNSLTSDGLYRAIKTILQQPRYQQRIAHASALMRDQTEHPLDRATFWIEYVIRHKGAPHLRTHVRHMSLWQRGLLDVTFILLCLATLMAIATHRIGRYAYSRLYLTPCSSDASIKRQGSKSHMSKK